MTTHYHIEITLTQALLKVTYRHGVFKKLEHVKGRLGANTLMQVGKIIPRTEADFEAYRAKYDGRVIYTPLVTVKSLYTQFVDAWHVFYESFYQLPPKFTGVEGKAMKSIIAHLKRLSNNDENEALAVWKIILQKWHTLDDFHKNNADLKYINSKLNIIINGIKQQNNTAFTSGTDRSVEL